LHVYLDQNKWIDLALAATGNPRGARYVDALDAARAAVLSGMAVFPLDIYRYLETGKRAHDRSRTDVADLMFELSQEHTMARPHTLLPREIDQTLKRRYGSPAYPRDHQVFGTGLRHITEGSVSWLPFDASKLRGDSLSTTSPEELFQIGRIYDSLVEHKLLRTGPETARAAGFDPYETEFGQRFVNHENSIGAALRHFNLSGSRLEMAVRASDLGDIQPAVTEALQRIGVTWDAFSAQLTESEVVAFMDDLPTRYVTNLMRAAKLRQSEQKWEPNDFNDIAALPVAVVHCDVVVTEKQWVHHLRLGKVEQRFKTILLSDAAELVGVLSSEQLPDVF
jgi:hypothetical protein